MSALRFAFAAALLAVAMPAFGSAAPRPVVVELFTTQACSDCPPAEALLRRLQAGHPNILALALHVTYFNGPGWTDRYSFKAATARQYWYEGLMRGDQVFTPQAVIDGRAGTVGSDRGAILHDIGAARPAAAEPQVQVSITPQDGGWRVALTGQPPARPAMIELFRFDRIDRTAVRGGENDGRHLTEIHVVRAITPLGAWTGHATIQHVLQGAGQDIAVLVQQHDGTILGAARS